MQSMHQVVVKSSYGEIRGRNSGQRRTLRAQPHMYVVIFYRSCAGGFFDLVSNLGKCPRTSIVLYNRQYAPIDNTYFGSIHRVAETITEGPRSRTITFGPCDVLRPNQSIVFC